MGNHDSSEQGDVDGTRRNLAAGFFSALGIVTLGGCLTNQDSHSGLVAETTQEIGGTGFQWVDTIVGGTGTPSNLRDTAGSATTGVAVVGGYNVVGDGGGGVFHWDPGSHTGDNGGTIIVPTASSTGRWRRIYSGALNAKWFGAGLGAADDQAVLQSVINVAGSQGGGVVYLPAGNYPVSNILIINALGVSVIGDGKNATFIKKTGIDSTIFYLAAAHYCQIADLSLTMLSGSPSTGSAIWFNSGSTGVTIQRVYIGSMWQGITCGGAVSPSQMPREVVIRDVKMENTLHIGMKMYYALNWSISSCVIGMHFDDAWNAPGSGHYGVWLDTDSEGCIFDTVFVLGGEHCWRIANSINPSIRGPNEHRFHSCIGDNGTVSEIYISSLHRSIFQNCWVSGQKSTQDAAVVMDSMDIWGVQWIASQVVNVVGHGIKVIAATSFSIVDSTFSEWNLSTSPAHSAVIVYPGFGPTWRCNFTIIGNQFIRDIDFGNHTNSLTISVTSGTYNRYIITNNLSYGGSTSANLGSGALSAVSDLGTAAAKVVNNNL